MQQYQVPQFINIEDRIIGPLTLKQFFYLLGAAGIIIVGWFFLYIVLFVLIAVPIAGLFIALAFATVNGRPFPTVFTGAINYYLKPRLYLWRQTQAKQSTKSVPQPAKKGESLLGAVPKLSESKLSDLAWSLDIRERIADRE